uniref:Snurportin-1 n=1 Tax=Pyrodinium bahamense TaxID=73915 RepID=A0A7S0AFU8_9DINO
MDVLVWGDVDLATAEAECRMFWLESRFAELPEWRPRRARPLHLVSATPATQEALARAYQSDVGYVKDSFQFVHREGHYCISEPVTPLVLMWRDRQLSRYVVDTPDQEGKVLPERQAVVLELRGGGRLRTADHCIVAQLSEEGLVHAQGLAHGKGPKSKALLRCEVSSVDIMARQLAGVHAVAHVAARSRVWADSWGRIVFQHLHRQGEAGAISFDALMGIASGN